MDRRASLAMTSLMKRYNFFAPEVLQIWKDPGCQNPRTLHHRGGGVFRVTGDSIKLPSNRR